MMNARKTLTLLCAAALLLAGCSSFSSDKKKPLPGERVSVLDLQKHIEPDNPALNAEGFIAPAAWKNDFWPQAGGYPGHTMQHLMLTEGPLKQLWKTSIGSGANDRLPLTAQPLVVDGRVFTVDTEANLSAYAVSSGKQLWKTSIAVPKKHEKIIGGGLAFGNGRLYATNGANELLCVTPEDGKIAWRVLIPAPARAAPTVVNDKVYVVTLDNRIFAMNAANGSIFWDYTGVTESAGMVGSPSPAASNDIVVPAFSSGEVFALHAENGTPAWGESLANASVTGMAGLSDIRGLPVLDKGVVFAVTFGGTLAALDERTGNRLWSRDIGSVVTPWLAGNHLFVLSTENELVSLGRDAGTISWVTPLPRFKDKDSHKHPLYWTAPILAGGRLILAGTAGDMLEVDPAGGKIIRTTKLDRPVTIDPVVAGGVLYLLGDDGTLMAFQ